MIRRINISVASQDQIPPLRTFALKGRLISTRGNTPVTGDRKRDVAMKTALG